MGAFQALYGNKAVCPARATGISPMQGDYVPPKTVWVRNDGNKHIKSLVTNGHQPPKPDPTDTNQIMATPQIPAKKAKRKLPADEDYSTAYKPPITPAKAPSTTPATKKGQVFVDGVLIETGIPIPRKNNAPSVAPSARRVVEAMQSGQSAELPASTKSTLGKAIIDHKQAYHSKWTTRNNPSAQTIRVWRLA